MFIYDVDVYKNNQTNSKEVLNVQLKSVKQHVES